MHRLRSITVGELIIFALNPKTFLSLLFAYLARRRRNAVGLTNARVQARLHPASPIFMESSDELLREIGQQCRLIVFQDQPLWIGVHSDRFFEVLLRITWLVRNAAVFKNGNEKINMAAADVVDQLTGSEFITVTFENGHGARREISIESYQWIDARDCFRSSNENNRRLRVVYDKHFFVKPGVSRAREIIGAPTAEDFGEPIDVVYTWVNHQDENWLREYRRFKPASDSDASSLVRFDNKDELRFSLRSLSAYAPWVNTIHILSNCAPPRWLDITHPKIRWIWHEQVIPEIYLPTFNSHVIESFLHRIPGLSEKFVYFNDDFYLLKRMAPTTFFKSNGCSVSFLEPYATVYGAPSQGDPDYLNAARNSARLISRDRGYYPTRLHKHVPYALSQSVLWEIEKRYLGEFDSFRGNRFRGLNDLNLPSFLYHAYAFSNRSCVEGHLESRIVKSGDMRTIGTLSTDALAIDVVCVNDGGHTALNGWHHLLRSFHKRRFPFRAEWER